MKCPRCSSDNTETSRFCSECGTRLFSADGSSRYQTQTLHRTDEEVYRWSVLGNRYEVIEELGKGGMGKVFRVYDKKLEEEVALKLLDTKIYEDKKILKRFRNEIKLARKIGHKHVCKMYDLSEEEGIPFITMEYVSGEDLKSFMRRSRQLTLGTALTIAKQVCEGLAEAHDLGIVHRDLKPGNIMIDNEGNAKIMDFGIARSIYGESITRTGVMVGTPDYMSPEQVEGKSIDSRTDLYSLGVILYEMATGKVPFEGDTPITVGVKHKTEKPREPRIINPQIPESLNRMILKCLAKDKGKRYQTADELLAELRSIEGELPTTEQMAFQEKRKRNVWAIPSVIKWSAAFIFIGILIYGGYNLWKGISISDQNYENFIAIEVLANDSPEIKNDLIEYLLIRSVTASTRLNVVAQDALKRKDRLIDYDLLKLRALMSRLNSKPIQERQYIRQLTEAFPFNKEYRYEFAESYFNCGDADEAIKHYTSALDLDPNFARAHNHIAFCYSWLGHHELAEEHFNKYVNLDNTANSYDSLACGYRFAGLYADSIDALNKGISIDPQLDYLYEGLARNYLLQGRLKEAVRTLEKYLEVAKRETSVARARFYLAYLEFLRGDLNRAIQELGPVITFYSDERHSNLVDDLSNQPFWLSGLIAARKGDLRNLDGMLQMMERKVIANKVNATNYFRIYKFYIHLKMIKAYLKGDEIEAVKYITEGRRIQNKMGYWYSMFDMAFFFNEYAQILIGLKKWDEALEFLQSVMAYNPSYASSRLKLAHIYLHKNNMDETQTHYEKAVELLSQSDEDYVLIDEARELGQKLDLR